MSKVVFITGVSSGFGKAIAGLLTRNGYIVYGTVRSEVYKDDSVNYVKMDLLDDESIRNAVDFVIQKEGRIDILINNAGMHLGGPFEEAPKDLFCKQLDTNIKGMVLVTQAVLPVMRSSKSGLIMNFSSIGGLMGLPFQSFYSASKFAIEGLSEALRMEVKAFGIKVVVINPGDFHTSNTANRRNIVKQSSPYETQFSKSKAQYESDEINGGNPDVMAKKILQILSLKNPANRYVISTFDQKLAVVLKAILPSKLFASILESHYKI